MRSKFVIGTALLTLLGLYAAVVLGAWYIQRRLMYFPDAERIAPASMGLSSVEERFLAAPDGVRVIAWYGRARPGQPTILYFHGNAGSLAMRSERIRKYMARGRGVYMMSYRGYSGSEGMPSERANVADAKRAYDALVAEGVSPADIIVYGESLGSGVAVQVAAEKPVGGIVLDAPYTSMVDVAHVHYPILPSRWFMTDRYETTRYIDRISASLLIIHGENDDVIPVDMGRKILAAAPGHKEIAVIASAGHDNHHLFGSYEVVNNWIDRLRSQPGPGAMQ